MNVSGCTLRVRCILHHPKIDPARKTCLPDKRRVRNIQHGPTGVQTRQCMERRIQCPQIDAMPSFTGYPNPGFTVETDT